MHSTPYANASVYSLRHFRLIDQLGLNAISGEGRRMLPTERCRPVFIPTALEYKGTREAGKRLLKDSASGLGAVIANDDIQQVWHSSEDKKFLPKHRTRGDVRISYKID
jgi:hypothetical protein